MILYSVCLAVPEACHLAKWTIGLFMLLQKAEFLYFLWLNVIPACVLMNPTSLIHSSVNTEVISLSLPLLVVLL